MIGQAFFNFNLNGRTANSAVELDNFSKDELWNYFALLNLENINLRSQNTALKSDIDKKISEISTLRAEIIEISELKDKICKLNEENIYLKNSIQELKNDNVELKKDNVELKKDNVELKKDNVELKKDNVELKKDNVELKKDNVELKKDNVELKKDNVELKKDNVEFKKDRDDLKKDRDDLRKEWNDMKQSLCAREIGIQTDDLVSKFVFSQCRKKPYFIRSFKNLVKFIDNPSSAIDISGDKAFEAWNSLSNQDIILIKKRLSRVLKMCPELKEYIENLKLKYASAHPPIKDFAELVEYFVNDDEDVVDALLKCKPFFEKTAFQSFNDDDSNLTDLDSA